MIGAWIRSLVGRVPRRFRRARIDEPRGALDPAQGPATFILAVGSSFDQRRPDAMMTCRMGYCRGFEQLGIPYLIVDIRELPRIVDEVPAPICMLFGGDLHLLSDASARKLRRHRCLVWLYPSFRDSTQFFESHALDPAIWTLPGYVVRRILDLEPDFGFTATVPSGLGFFESWERSGVPVCSLPLACDTSLYRRDTPDYPEFEKVQLAFVGGYWQSKGHQLDRYLRQFEDRLVIYGYNRWPYTGYRGLLPRQAEPSLYRQARLAPVVNEPTVSLLKGQINERVFKVLGSFGCTVVDAVPAYRELYSEDELLVSDGPENFRDLVRSLLENDELHHRYRQRGHEATLQRHTYAHRARTILERLRIGMPAAASGNAPRSPALAPHATPAGLDR